MTDIEKRILRLIPVGADSPRPGRYITDLLDLDIRTLRDHIHRLIVRHGVPIVAKRGLVSGYYIPQNEVERLAGMLPLQKQYDQEHKRIHALLTADLEDWRKYRDV
ncbi:DNA-binding protein [Streptococcus suis]|uniref:DNA-binding protein n=1 Tax=Streptococcus suis TaxID=1307 RepID=UPI00209A72B5|nr:DNA-binding protein [Streptococcus suis]MCO8240670.1 DNA-binding protein [Streptococcus suis]